MIIKPTFGKSPCATRALTATLAFVAATLPSSLTLRAQLLHPTNPLPSFEVATIKPIDPKVPGHDRPTRFAADCACSRERAWISRDSLQRPGSLVGCARVWPGDRMEGQQHPLRSRSQDPGRDLHPNADDDRRRAERTNAAHAAIAARRTVQFENAFRVAGDADLRAGAGQGRLEVAGSQRAPNCGGIGLGHEPGGGT